MSEDKAINLLYLLSRYYFLIAIMKSSAKVMRRYMLLTMMLSVKDAVNQLALHTPPYQGQKAIKYSSQIGKKLHQRNVKYLPKDVKKTQSTNDIDLLQKGYLYKMTYVDKNSPTAARKLYYKKMSKRRLKLTRLIKNRYLARIMWGYNLKEIGVKMPINVKQAIAACKNKGVSRYSQLNLITLLKDRYTYAVKITNHAIDGGGWLKNAKYMADKKARLKQARLAKKYQRKFREDVISQAFNEVKF